MRQVFSHRVFRPMEGLAPDEGGIAAGLAAAAPVLGALDAIAAEGLVLSGDDVSLADCHLAPIIDPFAAAPEGAGLLATQGTLHGWWTSMVARPSMAATDPGYGQAARLKP